MRPLLLGVGILAVLAAAPEPAPALEFFDGRLQIHGFYEMQTRVLARDYDTVDGFHLAQWWHVANVEFEADIAPQGWGPFDLVSGFMRVEARYDCVWTAGCHMVPGYRNRYGDDTQRLPRRLSDGRRIRLIGAIDPLGRAADGSPLDFRDQRRLIKLPIGERTAFFGAPQGLGQPSVREQRTADLWNLPVLGQLFFAGAGPDREFGTADDPGFYTLESFLGEDPFEDGYKFGIKLLKGNTGGIGNQVLGPWRPKDDVEKAGALRDRANPLRGPCPAGGPDPAVCDVRPDRGGTGPIEAEAALPYRPAPFYPAAGPTSPVAPPQKAQGLYLPNPGFVDALDDDDFRLRPDLNFDQTALSLNHGASQGPWNELKELYLDVELFDHQLWLRLGRQAIVWGKTEIFRAQDQFNPQDLGLASLPTLEESRIPQWAVRGLWSFYDVGPLTDVRLELALNLDEFTPLDTGRCGEPFAPRPACTRSFGFFANSLVGTGIAGERRPGHPLENEDALEGGLRLEFRRDRFSFALTYWNGRSDVPHPEPLYVFSRNVDPISGRPRRAESAAPCDPDALYTPGDVSGCLGTVNAAGTQTPQRLDTGDPATSFDEALEFHHGNLQLFSTICGATVTFSASLLPAGCGFNIWNSVELSIDPTDPDPSPLAPVAPTLSAAFSTLAAGQGSAATGLPDGNLFQSANGKSILLTLGRYADVVCGGSCPTGSRVEDDLPLVPLVFNGAGPGEVPGQDYDGATGGFLLPPNPTPGSDDELFCQRFAVRLGQPCNTDGVANARYDLWRPFGLARFLTDQQEALLGCGRHYGTDCDVDGFDLFNAEASAIYQSWPGIEGTERLQGVGTWDTFGAAPQPGTTGFANTVACTRAAALSRLPGCRFQNVDLFYDPAVDGTAPNGAPALPADPCFRVDPAERSAACQPLALTLTAEGQTPDFVPGPGFFLPGHPFTGQAWRSELSAVSWNLLMAFVAASSPADEADLNNDGNDDRWDAIGGRFDQFNPREAYSPSRCSYRNPLVCSSVAALLQVTAATAKDVRAGGNGFFGRRDFVWHGGAQVALDYQRRSVTGFAMDFAEDRLKANFNMEFTWFHQDRFIDNGSFELTSRRDTLNLVVSVDRPTFIRMLNRNRTFFMNYQIFLQGIIGWEEEFLVNGPVNALMTFSVFTGYYQDRLIPGATMVYDVNSDSGAFLWSLGYRFTQNFLLQFGVNFFFGGTQDVPSPLLPIGTTGIGVGRGEGAQRQFVENGLSTIRDRDEIFLRVRWTF